MLAQKIGRNIIPVVERFSELAQLLDCAKKLVFDRISGWMKLATKGVVVGMRRQGFEVNLD